MSAPRAVSQSCQTLASLSFLVRETDARVMLSPPELLLLGCSRFSFSTRWLSRCLAAAPLAQLFAAAAAGETVESGRSPHGEGQRPVPLERFWVLLRFFFLTLFRMDQCTILHMRHGRANACHAVILYGRSNLIMRAKPTTI